MTITYDKYKNDGFKDVDCVYRKHIYYVYGTICILCTSGQSCIVESQTNRDIITLKGKIKCLQTFQII